MIRVNNKIAAVGTLYLHVLLHGTPTHFPIWKMCRNFVKQVKLCFLSISGGLLLVKNFESVGEA